MSDTAARLERALQGLWARAADHDRDGADPVALCAPLREAGVFVDALPLSEGGAGLATEPTLTPDLLDALMRIGGCDLSAGRLYEGHVNAVKLVFRYGDAAQRRDLAADVRAGAVCGVWNAEAPPGLTLDRPPRRDALGCLEGCKIYASGLGLVSRPLVTARLPDGGVVMLAPRRLPHGCDLSAWTVRGMRATATGTAAFTGLEVGPEAVIGAPGDYYAAPLFKGGAWRFAAVQAGAVARLASLMAAALRDRGRLDDPHQRARLGSAALAAETAQLWVTRAALMAEASTADPDSIDAYVSLARLAVERAALEVVALAERGVGLAAFTRPSAIERVVRDLTTYLRQPFPDAALDAAGAHVGAAGSGPAWSVQRRLPG